MKDIRYRWRTMQGYYMPFWAGWDCQGLPVELEVEKLLGVKNKRELLERVGMERFIEECKKAIMRYHQMWLEADSTLGHFHQPGKSVLDLQRRVHRARMANSQTRLGPKPARRRTLRRGLLPRMPNQPEQRRSRLRRQLQRSRRPLALLQVQSSRQRKTSSSSSGQPCPSPSSRTRCLPCKPEAEYVKVKVGEEIWIMVEQRVEPVMQELGIKDYTITRNRLRAKPSKEPPTSTPLKT